MLPHQRTREFQLQKDILEILNIASGYKEDEFGNAVYIFGDSEVTATLHIDYGMDVRVILNVPTQSEPITTATLDACKEFRVIDDKRGRWIEFIGSLVSSNQGHYHLTLKAGLRLMLAPSISLQMFFAPVEGSLQCKSPT